MDSTSLLGAVQLGLTGVVTAALGWLAMKLPQLLDRFPELLDALRAWIHGSDTTLIRLALANGGKNAVTAYQKGEVTIDEGVERVSVYAKGSVGGVIAKIGMTDATLAEMALAAFTDELKARMTIGLDMGRPRP